ncbi:hypothetical protein KC343_g46 [Hortaea werneckii]|nr:hypothetical protein KC317_g45 [Hortaea werneckii]KAI7628701.1 hypothetical protein KC346_g48 [Hortaea werneckii]KAI7638458.1 hypothetical protein KC343_g46 [Hortaea werneckii]
MRQYAPRCHRFPFLFQDGQDNAASACEPRNRALTPSARLGALAGMQKLCVLRLLLVARRANGQEAETLGQLACRAEYRR